MQMKTNEIEKRHVWINTLVVIKYIKFLLPSHIRHKWKKFQIWIH